MKENKGLNVGETAPDFTSVDISSGQAFNLQSAAKQHRGILISFFRNDAWSTCHDFLAQVAVNLEEFKKMDVILVAIAFDTPENLQHMTKYGEIIISDYPSREIMTAFNTNMVKPGFWDRRLKKTNLAVPITFLIDSSGKIVWKFLGTPSRRPKNRVILQAISKYLWKIY